MKVFKRSMLLILALVVAGLIFMRFSPDYDIYIVKSESMKPAINMGDMVVISSLNESFNGEVKPGAIVTYGRGNGLVTHRVLSVDGDNLVTKGDAMEDPDPWPVTMSEVSGIYLFKIPYIGYLSNFMRTKLGWFLVVILPGMLLVGLLIKDIVKESLRNDEELGEPFQEPVVVTATASQQAVGMISVTAREVARNIKRVSHQVTSMVWGKSKPTVEATRIWTRASDEVVAKSQDINEPAKEIVGPSMGVFEEWISGIGEIGEMTREADDITAGISPTILIETEKINASTKKDIEAIEASLKEFGEWAENFLEKEVVLM